MMPPAQPGPGEVGSQHQSYPSRPIDESGKPEHQYGSVAAYPATVVGTGACPPLTSLPSLLSAYAIQAKQSCFKPLRHLIRLAWVLALLSAGSKIAISNAITAITTNSSTNVKPLFVFSLFNILLLLIKTDYGPCLYPLCRRI